MISAMNRRNISPEFAILVGIFPAAVSRRRD